MTLQNFTLGTFAQGAAAAVGAFESIASASGTGFSGTITFSSIPSTFQHLQVRFIARDSSASASTVGARVRLNGSTAAEYADHRLRGDGTSATASANAPSQSFIAISDCIAGGGITSGVMGVGIIDIHDYASTTKNKTIRVFSGIDTNSTSPTGVVALTSGLWVNTAAVNSITIYMGSNNFTTASQFALYGIKGA